MKKILPFILLGCLGLASCEKSKIITPTSLEVNKVSQSDSLKATNDEVIPPTLPSTGGWPK